MLYVIDGFVEKHRNVVVVEAVDDAAAGARSGDQAHRAEQAKLMGDGGLFHFNSVGQVVHPAGALAKLGENAQPARCSQSLQCRRYRRSGFGVELRRRPWPPVDFMSHGATVVYVHM